MKTLPVIEIETIIATLSAFWSHRGCLVVAPCELEIATPLMHPEGFFRLFDAKRPDTVLVQPIVRPLDGRYGRHPRRLAGHLQLQVLLTNEEADPQRLWLESLEALGDELCRHDVRFAQHAHYDEALAVRGWGWQMFIDGLDVGRITVIEEAAGRSLEAPPMEIVYGIEWLASALCGVDHVFDLKWAANSDSSYGALRSSMEVERSRFAFEQVDPADVIEEIEKRLDRGRRCLDKGLPRFAYISAIGCLRDFEILDARGVLSRRERELGVRDVREVVISAIDSNDGLVDEQDSHEDA